MSIRPQSVVLALAGALLFAPAHAHDSWISHNALRAPASAPNAGEWCCGEGDCGKLDRGAAVPTPRGWRVDGMVTIGEGTGAIREGVHELVPYAESQPSPDGEFWRCRRSDGSRRCFFAPPAPGE